MNMDYRKASIDLNDLNLEKSFNKTQAFRQSQLANMLLVLELSDRLKGSGVTCNAAYPGIVGGTGKKEKCKQEIKIILELIFGSESLVFFAEMLPGIVAVEVFEYITLLSAQQQLVSSSFNCTWLKVQSM